MLAGRAPAAADSITTQAGTRGLADDRRTGVEACVRYLTNNKEYLRYDQALASGWPIATGVVEDAPRPQMAELLRITGLDRTLTICATLDDARAPGETGMGLATAPGKAMRGSRNVSAPVSRITTRQ